MAVTFEASALSATTDSTTLNITLPTVQAGDVMFLEYTHRGTGTGTLGGVGGSGWNNKITQLYGAGSAFSCHLYWKRCDGSESGDALTVTGLTDSCAGCVTLYRGCVATGDPIEAGTGEANASGNESHAAITTLTNGAWVVLTVVNTPDLAITSQSTTSPGALAQRAERLNTTGTDTSIEHASAEKATAGSTGNLTWSQTNAASGSMAWAITPAMPSIAVAVGVLAMVGLSVGAAFTGPDIGAMVYQGHVPTVTVQSAGESIAIPAGSVVYQGYGSTADFVVPVPAGSLVYTGYAIGFGTSRDIPAGTLTFTGLAPTLDYVLPVAAGSVPFTGHVLDVVNQASNAIAVPAGSLVLTGQDVGVGFIGPERGALVFSGQAPTVSVVVGVEIVIPAGSLTFEGQYVGVAFLQPSPGSLVFTGLAPTLAASGQTNIPVPAGSLVLSGLAPSLTVDIGRALPAGGVVFTGETITVQRAVDIPAGGLVFTGQTGAVDWSTALPAGVLTFQGYIPELVGAGATLIPNGSLVLTGQAPAAMLAINLSMPAGAISITGQAPASLPDKTVVLPAGSLVYTGLAPSQAWSVGLPAGQVTFTGYDPVNFGAGSIAIPAGSLRFTGIAPVIAREIIPPAGTLTFAGQVMTVVSPQTVTFPAGSLVLTGRVVLPSPMAWVTLTEVSVGVPSVTSVTVAFSSLGDAAIGVPQMTNVTIEEP